MAELARRVQTVVMHQHGHGHHGHGGGHHNSHHYSPQAAHHQQHSPLAEGAERYREVSAEQQQNASNPDSMTAIPVEFC